MDLPLSEWVPVVVALLLAPLLIFFIRRILTPFRVAESQVEVEENEDKTVVDEIRQLEKSQEVVEEKELKNESTLRSLEHWVTCPLAEGLENSDALRAKHNDAAAGCPFASGLKPVPKLTAELLQQYGENGYVSEEFINLKQQTYCPFAKAAKVMGGVPWNPELSLEENIIRSIPLLLLFNTRVDRKDRLDGFVLEIADKSYGDTVEKFGTTVKNVLQILSRYDPEHDHAMFGPIHLNMWNFTFGGLRNAFFISTFAPCYTKSHSRYSYGSDSVFILLQPEISFHEKAVQLDCKPESVRHVVRKRFQQGGQPYDSRDRKQYTMLNWIVRPVLHTDPALAWWIESNKQPTK